MQQFIHKHKLFWSQKPLFLSAAFSLLLLLVSLFVNYFANVYTTSHVSNYVSDLILDNLPVVNVDFIFVEGFIILWIFVILLFVWEPKRMPFVVKSIAVFILIRSVFIMLTHLALPPDHSYLEPDSTFRYISAGNDMFFSSHAGLPYLVALNFWENKKLRFIFLTASVFFAIVVLFGHLHYSIDVFAAFFITYSIFHISQRLFPKDYELMKAN